MYVLSKKDNQTVNWKPLQKALGEVQRRTQKKLLPFTVFYWHHNELIGSYCCGDDEYPDFVLFAARDHFDPQLILQLIYQHNEILNDAVSVYLFDQAAMNKWSRINPASSINIML